MQVFINGELKDIPASMNIMELLEFLNIKYREVGLAVSINGNVIPKSEYLSTLVTEGDKIEIIHLVGGG